MRSEPEVTVKMRSEVETLPTRNTTIMYVKTNEKFSATIDKGQKPGHFCKIKKILADTIQKSEKEDMSGKTRTYGNHMVYTQ